MKLQVIYLLSLFLCGAVHSLPFFGRGCLPGCFTGTPVRGGSPNVRGGPSPSQTYSHVEIQGVPLPFARAANENYGNFNGRLYLDTNNNIVFQVQVTNPRVDVLFYLSDRDGNPLRRVNGNTGEVRADIRHIGGPTYEFQNGPYYLNYRFEDDGL